MKITRRSFLRGSALASATGWIAQAEGQNAAISAQALAAAAQIGPQAVTIALKVNGTAHRLNVEPRVTLAEALRGPLGLTGTKIACDRGACSACTVWLDGAPVCACMLLAVEVGGREVTTVEGLARAGALHPVQAAFVEHDAVQCGFCTPGMVMSCAALLARAPAPSAEEIAAALSGHLCRCGTYPHVVAAVLDLAASAKG